jgi:uncharacterized protein YodC (DUF2158 family)
MHITIKHAGRKTEIIEQSNGLYTCRVFDIKGNFLRSRTFYNVDAAFDFGTEWLYDMENNEKGEIHTILKDVACMMP